MECQKTMDQTAYPIFFDVEPTEVRHQSGAVGEAFAKLVGKGKKKLEDADLEKEEDVGRWRKALKDAAGLAGMELKTTFNGHENKLIQLIVQDISLKLRFINLTIDENLVGMETRVKNVVSSLEIDSIDVRVIGIKGIGGGGKTTLARAVFDHISIWFEGKSFVENIREGSKHSGLKELQKQVLKDVLNDQNIDVTSVSDGKNIMKRMMPSRKALVVLDDVDDIDQLQALAGELTWFKPGSRIIITTRDQQVLVAHEVNIIHNVNLLSDEEAICLFSRYAFKRDIPNQGFEELSRKVICYAAGLPLTIKVLGSHLCGRSELEWVDATERLKTIPEDQTLKRLEPSYNGLENDQKEIFLDVVCILKGEEKDEAIRILKSCGLNAQIGLSVLEQKSLITNSDRYGLCFHDHIEEMGWNIVRRSHNEPSKHSRLWIKEEIEDILANELGTDATRSIRLQFTNVNPIIIMKGLRKMKELRLLYVHEYGKWKDNTTSLYFPDALQSLCWHGYPFQSLVKPYKAKKLVKLGMCWSSISQPRQVTERKVLDKLRYLNLGMSKLETFDLGMTPHLETLDLAYCFDFVELCMPVECPKLKNLDLSGSKVSNLNLGMTPHLEELNLEGCSHLHEIYAPKGCLKKLVYLNLSGCSRFEHFLIDKRNVLPGLDSLAKLELDAQSLDICPLHSNNLPKFMFSCNYAEYLPLSSGNLEKLISFGLCACTNLESFSTSICGLQGLEKLTLKGSIPEVPEDLGRIQSLERLSLLFNEIKHLPDSICMLKHLKYLELESCWLLEQLPKDLGRLECLEELHLVDCVSLQHIPNGICKMKCLKYLDLRLCILVEELPEEVGCLKCLKVLDISGAGINCLPPSVYQLEGLRIIGSRGMLELYGFTSMTEISEDHGLYYVEL